MKARFQKAYEPSDNDAAAIEILDLLEELEGMGKKRKVKEELMAASPQLRPFFMAAYDWQRNYFVRQFPALGKKKRRSRPGPGAAGKQDDFIALLERLEDRVLTGNRALAAIKKLFDRFSELEAKWYKRVLLRDLKIGVGRKTLNKVWDKLIPVWDVQVASKLDKLKDADHLEYPLYADYKLDGIRLTVEVQPDGRTVARTRSGFEYPHLTHITEELRRMGPGFYDGEAYAGRWNKTSSLMRLDPDRSDVMERIQALRFHWFDLVPFWETTFGTQLTIRQRRIEMWRRARRAQTGIHVEIQDIPAINYFRGEWECFSNFSPDPVTMHGITYKTGEHAFHAQKAGSMDDAHWIRDASTPGEAKKRGRRIKINAAEWNRKRISAMRWVIQAKFAPGTSLARKLLSTGDAKLVEGNTWGDKFWGRVRGQGENWLGRLLMEHRETTLKLDVRGERFQHVTMVPIRIMNSPQDVYDFYAEALDKGYEGVMLKKRDGLWQFTDKRDGTWIKVKPMKTVEGEIVGYHKHSRESDWLGSWQVEYKGELVNVGGAMTDRMRERFWREKNERLGQVVEFKVQDDPDDVAVVRFPQFVRFRPDKAEGE